MGYVVPDFEGKDYVYAVIICVFIKGLVSCGSMFMKLHQAEIFPSTIRGIATGFTGACAMG